MLIHLRDMVTAFKTKSRALIVAVIATITFVACNSTGGADAGQGGAQYDIALCQRLIAVGQDNTLTDAQLDTLAVQFENMFAYCEGEVARIYDMPKGEDKCEAILAFRDAAEVGTLEHLYRLLDHADRQAGFTQALGRRLKDMNVSKRRKDIKIKLTSIYGECK